MGREGVQWWCLGGNCPNLERIQHGCFCCGWVLFFKGMEKVVASMSRPVDLSCCVCF